MLRAMMISPDRELSASLEETLAAVGHVGIVRSMDRYPTGVDLVRTLRAHAPQVLFLSIESLPEAMRVIEEIEQAVAGLQIVAIGHGADSNALIELMRVGVREFLASPFPWPETNSCIARINETLERKPLSYDATDLVYSFLPSKPGVGASTICMNSGVYVARSGDTRSLLIDFDMSNGLQRFMMKLDNEYSITDAAEHAFELDENLWPQLVSQYERLDVLHSGRVNPSFRIEQSQVRHLLDFARRIYRVICIDLSGNLERYSMEVIQESKKVFLVCTQEISSLHLAREKLAYLRELDLGDRVVVLLNRAQKKSAISAEQVEELMGVPVLMGLPNDYQGIHRALTVGKPVEAVSDLGKQFARLARYMVDRDDVPTQAAPEPKRRFVEYFSMLPGRYAVADKKSS